MVLNQRIRAAVFLCTKFISQAIDFSDFKRELTALEPNIRFSEFEGNMFVSSTLEADFYIDVQFARDDEGYWEMREYIIDEYEE